MYFEIAKYFLARQAARMEGAVIPPTPMHQFTSTHQPSQRLEFTPAIVRI